MTSDLLVAVVYNLILYGILLEAALPFVFLFLWTFLDFWKKHVVLFYVAMVLLFAGTLAVFYLTNRLWVYWYYVFPSWMQIFGLLLIVFTYVVVKLAQASLTIPVRFFYSLLKGKKVHLQTKGVYRYVRHPIYAVFPLAVLGAFFYTGQFIFLPVLVFNLLARNWYVEKEEAYLRKTAGSDYEKYMEQTPHRFYPKLF